MNSRSSIHTTTTSSDRSNPPIQNPATQAQHTSIDTSKPTLLQSQPVPDTSVQSAQSPQPMPLPPAHPLTNFKPSHLKYLNLAPVPQPPTTPPVSQRTWSHKLHCSKPPVYKSPVSPIALQSQARAMPLTPNILPSPFPSPVAGRTRRQLSQKFTAPFSPYPSPLSITGAIRKQSTQFYPETVKFPSIKTHPQLFSPYSQGSQKDHPTHRRKKAKPY